MAKPTQLVYTHAELARILVEHENIKSGDWGIFVRFGHSAANIKGPDGKFIPAAIVSLVEVGIQRFDEPNNLTVDAADLPGAKPKAKSTAKKKARAKKATAKKRSKKPSK